MKKKTIIISVVSIILIGLLTTIILCMNRKETKEEFDSKVVSTITLDINPSIKIQLNKNKLVVNVISLNDDAKNIVKGNYKGKEFNKVLSNITNKLEENNYIEDNLYIIVGVSGDIKDSEVKKVIEDNLNTLDIKYNIIIPVVNDSSKEIAKKYNITESKAAYIEEISSKYSEIKIEDISNMNIKDIVDKTNSIDNSSKENTTTTNNNKEEKKTSTGNKTGGGYGSLKQCEKVNIALTNEEAGKKIASLMGASVGTGSYCDKLPPESVMALTSNNVCAYKVSFAYRTKSCVYYVGVETGNILGDPSCSSKLVEEGEAQCIIMESMGIRKREEFYPSVARDTGSEWVYEVGDVYGKPDENGKRYVYEYHVSKSTGTITSKSIIRELT